MAFQNPVVFVPGLTGTSLVDDYPLEPRTLWSAVLHEDFERLSMHPDDPRYEAVEPARVAPGRLLGLVYDDLVRALRHDLSPRRDEPTPVFAFPYDWRQPLADSAERLGLFLEEVLDRTRLLKHYKGWRRDRQRVDLVGHSMGGLVIAEHLHAAGRRARVRKVATLGTPFLGSVEAVAKLCRGDGSLGGEEPVSREREAARSTPSIYQLLPSYAGAVQGEDGEPGDFDLFDPACWQGSLVASLSEYVRLHSVRGVDSPDEVARAARRLFRNLLDGAREHRGRVRRLSLRRAELEAPDWLAVAGAGEATRVAFEIRFDRRGRKRFRIGDRGVDDFPDSRESGDGSVPLASAVPPCLGAEQVVVVTPEELGFQEVRDRALGHFTGLHALLPNVNVVQRLVIKHLRPGFRGPVSGHPLPGVARRDWRPPVAGLR